MIEGAVYITRPYWRKWEAWATVGGQVLTRGFQGSLASHVMLAAGKTTTFDVGPGEAPGFEHDVDIEAGVFGAYRRLVPSDAARAAVLGYVRDHEDDLDRFVYTFGAGVRAAKRIPPYLAQDDERACSTLIAYIFDRAGFPLTSAPWYAVLPADLARISERTTRP